MPRPPLQIELSPGDRRVLRSHLKSGVQPVRSVLRALALSQIAQGVSAAQIARVIPMTEQAIRRLRQRFEAGGLQAALYDKPRPGAVPLLDSRQQKRIVAMVLGEPPAGRRRWTVRLAAEEAVKRRLVPRAGREAIRLMLLRHGIRLQRG